MSAPGFQVFGIPGLPMVEAGDDLAGLVLQGLEAQALELVDGDVICLAQKIVSKAEGRLVTLDDVEPSPEAISVAEEVSKDPRLIELILRESDEILRKRPGIIIVRHRLGFVLANAGIDQSNVDQSQGERALLLPVDPDGSARALRETLAERTGASVGVIITDSANRPWRLGTTGIAIGAAGVAVLDDHRGGTDVYGRELRVTLINNADAIANAATLVMGETTERIPLTLVRGLEAVDVGQDASIINRPLAEDLFR